MTYSTNGRLKHLLVGTSLVLTMSAAAVSEESIRFWTTEEQPDRLANNRLWL